MTSKLVFEDGLGLVSVFSGGVFVWSCGVLGLFLFIATSASEFSSLSLRYSLPISMGLNLCALSMIIQNFILTVCDCTWDWESLRKCDCWIDLFLLSLIEFVSSSIFSLSKNSFLTSRPLVSSSKINTLFTISSFWPNFNYVIPPIRSNKYIACNWTNYWKYWKSKHPVKWHELTIQTLLCRPHDIPIIIYNITFTEYKNYIYYFKPKDGSIR